MKVATLFRNASIAVVGAAMTVPAFAAIEITGIQEELQSAGTNAQTVAGYVAGTLVVLAAAGIIFSLLRKS